jgi:hypothetical protein
MLLSISNPPALEMTTKLKTSPLLKAKLLAGGGFVWIGPSGELDYLSV